VYNYKLYHVQFTVLYIVRYFLMTNLWYYVAPNAVTFRNKNAAKLEKQ